MLNVEINGYPVLFDAIGRVAKWRVKTLRTKEPATIAWLEAMPEGSVLWDIGANIGIYTIYAAALGHTVVAVEPENEYVNSLRSTLAASCLNVRVTIIHDCMGPLDDYVARGIPAPTHIKIDTDGDELAILQGAVETLQKVDSVIVETDANNSIEREQIDRILSSAGLEKRSRHCCPLVTSKAIGMDHWFRT